jgi:hypothetical protein
MLPFQEFVKGPFVVRYQCQAEPQLVELEFELDRVIPDPAPWSCLRTVGDLARFGGGGSTVFAPTQGLFEEDNFRFGEALRTEYGPRFHFRFRLGGVAPLYFRFLFDDFTLAHGGVQYKAQWRWVRLEGSAPILNDALTVTDAHVRAWVDDPTAYLSRWPDSGFLVREESSAKGVQLELEFLSDLGDALFQRLEDLLFFWPNTTAFIVYEDGSPVTVKDFQRFDERFPRIARKKKSLRAAYERLPHARGPSTALLVNMLARIHAESPCLRSLTLRM